jgi:hypothetical protein
MTDLLRIRLLADRGASHKAGAVLTIADDVAAAHAVDAVTRGHAHHLVASGAAEWIGQPPQDAA